MDNKVIAQMVKDKYLRKIPSMAAPGCDYCDTGDLTKTGVICCRLHGTVEGPKPPPPSIWDRIMYMINKL